MSYLTRSYAVPYDDLYGLTSAPVGVYCRWLKWFLLADTRDKMTWTKQTGNISICCRTPTVAQTLRLKIFTNGSESNLKFNETKTIATGVTDKPQILYWPSTAVQGEVIGLELSGTWTVPMQFEWISMDYEYKSPSKGTQLG